MLNCIQIMKKTGGFTFLIPPAPEKVEGVTHLFSEHNLKTMLSQMLKCCTKPLQTQIAGSIMAAVLYLTGTDICTFQSEIAVTGMFFRRTSPKMAEKSIG